MFSGQVAIQDNVLPPCFCSSCVAVCRSMAVVAARRRTRRRDGTRNAARPTTSTTSRAVHSSCVRGEARDALATSTTMSSPMMAGRMPSTAIATPAKTLCAREDDGDPPGEPLPLAEPADQQGDDEQGDAEADEVLVLTERRTERAVVGDEVGDDLGHPHDEQARHGEQAPLAPARAAGGGRVEPAGEPRSEREARADGEEVFQVGERADVDRRDQRVDPQREPHPQAPRRPQQGARDRGGRQRSRREPDVEPRGRRHRPRPVRAFDGDEEQARPEDRRRGARRP